MDLGKKEIRILQEMHAEFWNSKYYPTIKPEISAFMDHLLTKNFKILYPQITRIRLEIICSCYFFLFWKKNYIDKMPTAEEIREKFNTYKLNPNLKNGLYNPKTAKRTIKIYPPGALGGVCHALDFPHQKHHSGAAH